MRSGRQPCRSATRSLAGITWLGVLETELDKLETWVLIFNQMEIGRAGAFVTLDRYGALAVYRGYNHLTSDESIEDGIIANEYIFTAGGAAVRITHGRARSISCRISRIYVYSAQMETHIMQELPEFKAADLTRHTSDLFDAAIRSPIAITKHRKPKFVLMSMDQYRHLTRGATQQAHMVDEMPEDLKALMIEGLERDLTQADD